MIIFEYTKCGPKKAIHHLVNAPFTKRLEI